MFHVEHFVEKFLKGVNTRSILENLRFLEKEYFKWNKVINLSSIRDEKGFWEKHILDSLCLTSHIRRNYSRGFNLIDIGTGCGFPGLVLAVCLDNKIQMVEPIRKKVDFINHCIKRLKLEHADVFEGKFQNIDTVCDKTIVVSRALGMNREIYSHFSSINPNIKVILMTTRAASKDIPGDIYDEEYDFLNSLTDDALRDHILLDCYI